MPVFIKTDTIILIVQVNGFKYQEEFNSYFFCLCMLDRVIDELFYYTVDG